MKPLTLLAFNILRPRLPGTTPYVEFQRATQESSSLFVTYTTVLWSVPLQQELARWANSGLTPWLKRGGCAAGLLSRNGQINAPDRVLMPQA
jgi:hypothetical protein